MIADSLEKNKKRLRKIAAASLRTKFSPELHFQGSDLRFKEAEVCLLPGHNTLASNRGHPYMP